MRGCLGGWGAPAPRVQGAGSWPRHPLSELQCTQMKKGMLAPTPQHSCVQRVSRRD